MFNKYLRYYPWWLQLLLLVMMLFIVGNFAIVIDSFIFPKITGFSISQILDLNKDSTGPIVRDALWLQGFSHLCTFLAPSLLFAYLAHPRPRFYLGLRAPGRKIHWLLVSIMAIGAIPVFIELLSFMHLFHLGKLADEMQDKIESTQIPFLNMSTFGTFIFVLIIMALVPALGEEMLFRGVLMRFAKKRSKSNLPPIIITGLLFALIHFEPYGILSIFAAGLLLGAIYYLTGSLWCSILFHFLNNGVQIFFEYLGNSNKSVKTVMESNTLPPYILITGALIMAISFYLLYKTKTPLPDGWEKDFTPEELEMENPAEPMR
jgi:membrane protease YdiL (CAAX protease family)